MENLERPIEVPTATREVSLTALRYILTAVGAMLVSRGWFSEEEVNQIVGIALLVIPTAYGMWRARHNNSKLQVAERLLPNEIMRKK